MFSDYNFNVKNSGRIRKECRFFVASTFYALAISISISQFVFSYEALFYKKLHHSITQQRRGPYENILKVNIYNHEAGFFSWFKGVIGCLEYYEQHRDIFTGIEIGFFNAYQENEYGSNWWSYYFDPIYIDDACALKTRMYVSTRIYMKNILLV